MGNRFSERKKGILALILLSLVFASMGIFIRDLHPEFTVLQQIYLRVFGACIFGILIFYKDIHYHKLRLISKKEWVIILIRSLALYVIGLPFLTMAFLDTKYSNVSFISSVPATAILGFIVLREKVTLQKLCYITIGFVGVMLIAVKNYAHVFSWGNGEMLALSSSIFFALSYIARKWHGNLLNNKEIAVLIFFISSVLLFIISLLNGDGMPHSGSFTGYIPGVLILAALFNVANLFLTNYGFQKVQAVFASNLLMLEVVFAVCIGVFYYRELPLVNEMIGGLLIIFSAYRMNKLNV